MIFNSYVWGLYKESKAGKKAIEYYHNFSVEDGVDMVIGFRRPAPFEINTDEYDENDAWADHIGYYAGYFHKHRVAGSDDAYELYNILTTTGIPIEMEEDEMDDEDDDPMPNHGGRDELGYVHGFIDVFSISLYLAHPDYYIPYLFRRNFYKVEQIANLFNISLPPLPGSRNSHEKVMYYWSLNQVFQEFRAVHGLSPSEMCAFLYDFSTGCIESSTDRELPEPSKVWLSVGGDVDFEGLDKANDQSSPYWSGNKYAKKGDIQIIYCRGPRKYIHSIWRISSDAYVDPFYHYFNTVWMTKPVLLDQPISFHALKADSVWKHFGRLKANMQGLKADRVTVEQYHRLLDMIKATGQDISPFPKIEHEDPEIPGVSNEREVELQLIEPLLKKLGYAEQDWQRQVPIRMGTGQCFYPDYAIGYNPKKNEETAKMLVEAKYDISGDHALQEAYFQAKSYATQLQAGTFMIASRNGIWVFSSKGNSFNIDKCVQKTWKDLKNKDEIFELSVAVGRKIILA